MENDPPAEGLGAPLEADFETVELEPEPGFPEKESSLHFEIAIGRNPQNVRPGLEKRVAVEQVWRDMADGTADRYDRDEWLTYIAKRIVSDVIDSTDEKGKGSAALLAIGLLGRRMEDTDLLNALQTLLHFADLDAPGRRITQAENVKFLRRAGYLKGLSDTQAKSKIKNLIQNRLPRD